MIHLSETASFAIEQCAQLLILLAVVQNGLQVLQLVLAARSLRDDPPQPRSDLVWQRSSEAAPAISILAPAYNEAETIVESVRSLLLQKYPLFEVVVINDGSTDGTLGAMRAEFGLVKIARDSSDIIPHAPVHGLYISPLHPNLLVIDKQNAGKADALNAGINYARCEVFCSMDADSILEPDALLRVAQPFVLDPERVIAAGGTVRIANGCIVSAGRVKRHRLPSNLLALLQTVEYMRAFLMARLAWSRVGTLTIISGAFGLFRRSAVIEAGGYARGLVGEDMELVVRLHRIQRELGRDYRIVFVPEPVCWTEAPETLGALSRQRRRWQQGSLEAFTLHRTMLLNARYGRIGLAGLGGILIVDIVGPIAEALGYLLLPAFCLAGVLSVEFLLAFLVANVVLGISVSIGSLVLEEQKLRQATRTRDLLVLAGCAALENLGYRQLNSVWRLMGCWDWLRGNRAWGEMQRKGFSGV